MGEQGLLRWWERATVVMVVVASLFAYSLHSEGNSGCRLWEHRESLPGGVWCESYGGSTNNRLGLIAVAGGTCLVGFAVVRSRRSAKERGSRR